MTKTTILMIISTALLVVNGLLINQNLALQAKIKTTASAESEIKEGDTLPDFNAGDLAGNPVRINYNADPKKQILLYFHTQCGFCKKQMPYWKKLAAEVDKTKFNVTAITTESDAGVIKNYLNNFETGAWKVLSIKNDDAQKAGFSGTPTTVVVNSNGEVEKVWVGMWLSKEIYDAGQYFDLDFEADKISLQ